MEGEAEPSGELGRQLDHVVHERHHAVRAMRRQATGGLVGVESGDVDHRAQASQQAIVDPTLGILRAHGMVGAVRRGRAIADGRPLGGVDDPDHLGGVVDALEDV